MLQDNLLSVLDHQHDADPEPVASQLRLLPGVRGVQRAAGGAAASARLLGHPHPLHGLEHVHLQQLQQHQRVQQQSRPDVLRLISLRI